MEDSSNHITNLNKVLKNIKSETIIDFVWPENSDIAILINKVTSALKLQTIENYIKNINYIEAKGVEVSQLSQSKSYLKIICIPYLKEDTNTFIISDVVEKIIKKNHIFNNIILASRSYIIKVSPKLDMAIIWIDIWNVQNSNKAKDLMNRYFNVGSNIMIIKGANMNPNILQCKNC